MAVTSFDEIHQGRAISSKAQGGVVVGTYHHVYRAITDSALDNGDVVRNYAGCPKEGWGHPTNPFAYCCSVDARNEGISKTVWLVTVVYSTARQYSENPLDDPADIKWRSEQYQRPAFVDKDDDKVLNSAGDYYDPPPMRDDSRWIATVQKNLAAIPSWIVNYQDAINSSTFTIDALSVAARLAKMQAIEISSWQYRDGVPFRTLTMVIAIAKDGFAQKYLDQGFNEKDPGDATKRIRITLDDGSEPVAPVALDGAGARLANPSPDNAEHNTHYIYEERDFNVLPLV